MQDMQFIKGKDIFYAGMLKSIKKDKNPMRPLFEALTNSIESIYDGNVEKPEIHINIYVSGELDMDQQKDFELDKIEVIDNGLGFDDNSFERFSTINDNRKGHANKGAGRLQFLKSFETTKIKSIFSKNNQNYERNIEFSASSDFLNSNAIIKTSPLIETNEPIKTSVVFCKCLNEHENKILANKSSEDFKNELLAYFLLKFTNEKMFVPIFVQRIQDENILDSSELKKDDCPEVNKKFDITVPYQTFGEAGFIPTENEELIKVTAFKLEADRLKKYGNDLILTSKGEIVESIKLSCLAHYEEINHSHYLFMLSSNYFDENVADDRSKINIASRKNQKKYETYALFGKEELFIEDIEEKANLEIEHEFPEITQKRKDFDKNIQELQKLFNLDTNTIKDSKLLLQDDDRKILEKIYKKESEKIAKKDAELKKFFYKIKELNPSANNYQVTLEKLAKEISNCIPLQNKNALSQYFARRKIVLDEMQLVLKRTLDFQKVNKRNIDEKLLHNIIFQQHTSDPFASDLWLLSEDFIYFQGTSESKLCDIKIDDEIVFLPEISKIEDEYYYNSKKIKRPDVLLFPEEEKCIIIEFKSPNVNVSEYLYQINQYASWIRTYTTEKYNIRSFYGYLIGEEINFNDIRSADSDFIHSYQFDYCYRPTKRVAYIRDNSDTNKDGSLYMEIISYSTLLKRAYQRNQIFLDKLGMNSLHET